MNEIAVHIRAIRREKGLSQEQLAQALHVTRQTVSAWERGLSLPGLDTLGELARAWRWSRSGCSTGTGERGSPNTAAWQSGQWCWAWRRCSM